MEQIYTDKNQEKFNFRGSKEQRCLWILKKERKINAKKFYRKERKKAKDVLRGESATKRAKRIV